MTQKQKTITLTIDYDDDPDNILNEFSIADHLSLMLDDRDQEYQYVDITVKETDRKYQRNTPPGEHGPHPDVHNAHCVLCDEQWPCASSYEVIDSKWYVMPGMFADTRSIRDEKGRYITGHVTSEYYAQQIVDTINETRNLV